MKFPSKIKVQAEMDRMGAVVARPVDDRYAKAFAKAAKENGGPGDLDVYFGDDSQGRGSFLNDMPVRARKELERGYTATWTMDPWEVAHWYGYDAHTVCEGSLDQGGIVQTGSTGGVRHQRIRRYVIESVKWSENEYYPGTIRYTATINTKPASGKVSLVFDIANKLWRLQVSSGSFPVTMIVTNNHIDGEDIAIAKRWAIDEAEKIIKDEAKSNRVVSAKTKAMRAAYDVSFPGRTR